MKGRQIRLPADEKPPIRVEYEGRTYAPEWMDASTQMDRNRGERLWVITEWGDPVYPENATSDLDDDGDDREHS